MDLFKVNALQGQAGIRGTAFRLSGAGASTQARALVCDAVCGSGIKFANLHRPTNPCHELLSVTHV
jgi:hypothetical protein